ncbi:MAG TPA: fused MFS/spermidine synthase [Flavilitoribacter sp.]|nr:fused MFS/spermidine synthase [Flavilitoribacter sp.]HMQ88570.1 fused MFS/spermidine synthase [Flavilitoribacter sp.]
MNSEPFWKRGLSYLWDIHIESTESDFNPELHISLRRGRYQLCTTHAVYSYEDRYDNFVHAFQRIRLDRLADAGVLVLGLGLASIPTVLEHRFRKNFRYTAVEIDEAVIDLAGRYALPFIQSPVEIVCADAFAYVRQTDQQFDLICMDVFQDDVVPSDFERFAFLEAIQQLIAPGGMLLYNRLAASRMDKKESRAFFEETFMSVFRNGALIDVGANYLLLNDAEFLR